MKRLLPALLLLLGAARADYSIPRAAETRFLVAHEWKVEKERLTTEHGAYRIDLFWLADRIDSNCICCGDHEAEMRDYLAGLKRDLPLVVELVNTRKGEPMFVAGIRPLTAKRIAKDLVLVAKRAGDKLDITLVNRSKVTYHVVVPRDGSESGWREPHVFFTGVRDGKPLAKRTILRCGVFARDWRKDIVALKPGASLSVGQGYAPPNIGLEFPEQGKVRLRAHYAYRGGKSPHDEQGPGAMGTTPAFELVSNPVELQIG